MLLSFPEQRTSEKRNSFERIGPLSIIGYYLYRNIFTSSIKYKTLQIESQGYSNKTNNSSDSTDRATGIKAVIRLC